ncbi:hypothetical protein [Bacillus sp. FJAT-45350]|uniref:hypothetical protein n=1 Tax=Bacillus sp. FJAT-45350 TaxID=2011014 RepID=UPI0015CA028B|nr:hypothetical protein [Bacillus sp. FJAT-45350]
MIRDIIKNNMPLFIGLIGAFLIVSISYNIYQAVQVQEYKKTIVHYGMSTLNWTNN